MPETDAWPGDFYHLRETLPAEDRARLDEIRAFMGNRVAPLFSEQSSHASFPHGLVPDLGPLGAAGTSCKGNGLPGRTALPDGLVALEVSGFEHALAHARRA